MFTFCPACASRAIRFEQDKVSRCPDCGFVYYHNVAAATGCVIDTGTHIAFTVRAKEPAKGKLALPGGFVNPDEGAFDGLRRECREEIDWDPVGVGAVLYASFPNIYPYKGVVYHTCDLFFSVFAPDVHLEDFHLDPSEIAAVRFIAYNDVQLDDLAFASTRLAIQAFLKSKKVSGTTAGNKNKES
jgi:ADP-ribose pyrophosphatase YjhB (NUDIX family)